jgi:SAM-dependent methyltransferase
VGDAESAATEFGDHFDVVRLSHSFEHLHDPAATLTQLGRLLAPGGRLILITPNAEGALAVALGRDWFQLDPPRHLWSWGPRTLRLALCSAGFDVRAVHHRSESRAVYHSFRYAAEANDESLPPMPSASALTACEELAESLDAAESGDAVLVVAEARAPAD